MAVSMSLFKENLINKINFYKFFLFVCMNNYAHDIISTRLVRKHKERSEKCRKDHQKIIQRIQVNGIKMDFVSEYIDRLIGIKVTYLSLLSFADYLSRNLEIKLDRLAKRNRNALLCWYAENWDRIQPHILELKVHLDKNTSDDEHNFISACREKNQKLINETFIDPSDIFQLLNDHS